MPFICYIDKRFNSKTLRTITQANNIINEYMKQGFNLTLRQLYYQFVARDLIPNLQREYSRLGYVVNDARLAGMIDWNAIEDRTRELRSLSHWSSPSSIIHSAAMGYNTDKWENQACRLEVWIEKDALMGVIESICNQWDVPYFSCRGYTSQSEMWGASQRLVKYSKQGQKTIILHLGDHDPSGLDMTRDIQERLITFMAYERVIPARVIRLGLNHDQIQEHNPPPNPAKLSDSRAEAYIHKYGFNSWELDALEPAVISGLIEEQIKELVDLDQYQVDVEKQEKDRETLNRASHHWEEVEIFLEEDIGTYEDHFPPRN